jgi:hypothetical protein
MLDFMSEHTWNCGLALRNQNSPVNEGNHEWEYDGGSVEQAEQATVVVAVFLAWRREELLNMSGSCMWLGRGGVVRIVKVHIGPDLR